MRNEELLREAVAAFNRSDRAAIDRLLDPAFVLASPLSDMRGQPYEGHDGAHQWVDDLNSTFEVLDIVVDEVEEVRGDRVLGLGRAKVTGRNSGMDYERKLGIVMEMRDGRICKIWVIFDQDEARRSAAELD